jgi:hypothetical protein
MGTYSHQRSILVCTTAMFLFGGSAGAAQPAATPKFSTAVAFDVSRPVRELAPPSLARRTLTEEIREVRPDRGPVTIDRGFGGDHAIQRSADGRSGLVSALLAPPLLTFEGLSNNDNFALYGGRVNPPDPVGDIGPNHYVEMVNLAFAVYDRSGNALTGPTRIGDLWAGFAIADCTDPSGDPIVVYDQLRNRWLLSQFTTRGPTYYNCVAISRTGDPTGAYFRYAFSAGPFFPDYPKYGVWTDSYILTSRDFGPTVEYGISVYALEKKKMVQGDPNARAVQFFLDSAVVPIALIGDGLLPPDLDGTAKPPEGSGAPVVGTQDNGGPYGAAFDALNIWELEVVWNANATASLVLATQLPVAEFDSIFPCAPTSRDCLPQPGVANPTQKLDILSYRQRPTWRLAYRHFGDHESLVTNQSVEARPAVAGVRWYEIRRVDGAYSVHQQGTFAPDDGIHRWMGSAAMDRLGNIALGYSVVNGINVFPGIRVTGRLAADASGVMTLGEAMVINGSGVQTTMNSRWGDYTSLNLDPRDDCTFWYVNEYYTAAGQASSPAGWQTRIASFRLPGCASGN